MLVTRIDKKMDKDTKKFLEYNELYKGKLFKYHSKYGGTVENIICDGVSVHEKFSVKNGEVQTVDIELSIISDKGNVYEFKKIEFYGE